MHRWLYSAQDSSAHCYSSSHLLLACVYCPHLLPADCFCCQPASAWLLHVLHVMLRTGFFIIECSERPCHQPNVAPQDSLHLHLHHFVQVRNIGALACVPHSTRGLLPCTAGQYTSASEGGLPYNAMQPYTKKHHTALNLLGQPSLRRVMCVTEAHRGHLHVVQ